MKNVLCLSELEDNILNFVKNANFLFFQMEPLDPEAHNFSFFEEIYNKLKECTDLSKVDLIIAENIEAIPLVYFMRKEGHFCPAIFIPHTNAYPLNILFYFLLVSELAHPDDLILCGSKQAAKGYREFVNMKALPICTFGIKNMYKKGDKHHARTSLGLPQNKKILLYTGRFMNDKGLVQLLDIYEKVKKEIEDVVLVLSITHIDSEFYNTLAPKMLDVILFYRLEQTQMVALYQSADLFVSVSTSIFETYGKSPLEAISCGVPVVLPNWDGFRYYIHDGNGSLADVIYTDFVEDAPFSFAISDTEDFVNKSCFWLSQETINLDPLPKWAYYEETMATLSKLTRDLMDQSRKFHKKVDVDQKIDFSKYPNIIQKICSFYDIYTCVDLEIKTEELGLINRQNPGELHLLKELHDELFQTMDAEDSNLNPIACSVYSNLSK